MKSIITGAILIVLISIYSACQQKDDGWIVGKWDITSLEPADSTKPDIGVGLTALGIALSDGMEWEFLKDRTFEATTKKDKEVFAKGTYELIDNDQYLDLKSDDGEKEKRYEIIKTSKDKISLKNAEDNILMTFVSRN